MNITEFGFVASNSKGAGRWGIKIEFFLLKCNRQYLTHPLRNSKWQLPGGRWEADHSFLKICSEISAMNP